MLRSSVLARRHARAAQGAPRARTDESGRAGRFAAAAPVERLRKEKGGQAPRVPAVLRRGLSPVGGWPLGSMCAAARRSATMQPHQLPFQPHAFGLRGDRRPGGRPKPTATFARWLLPALSAASFPPAVRCEDPSPRRARHVAPTQSPSHAYPREGTHPRASPSAWLSLWRRPHAATMQEHQSFLRREDRRAAHACAHRSPAMDSISPQSRSHSPLSASPPRFSLPSLRISSSRNIRAVTTA